MSLKSGLINFGERPKTFNLEDVLLVGEIGRDPLPYSDKVSFSYDLFLRDFSGAIESKCFPTFEEAKQTRDALVEAWVEYLENKEERQCRR